MVSFTNPFILSSKAFFALILESDKAGILDSLPDVLGLVTGGTCGFSCAIAIGFKISVFEFKFSLPMAFALPLVSLLFSFFGTSAIE